MHVLLSVCVSSAYCALNLRISYQGRIVAGPKTKGAMDKLKKHIIFLTITAKIRTQYTMNYELYYVLSRNRQSTPSRLIDPRIAKKIYDFLIYISEIHEKLFYLNISIIIGKMYIPTC